jgi:hypothetical protein
MQLEVLIHNHTKCLTSNNNERMRSTKFIFYVSKFYCCQGWETIFSCYKLYIEFAAWHFVNYFRIYTFCYTREKSFFFLIGPNFPFNNILSCRNLCTSIRYTQICVPAVRSKCMCRCVKITCPYIIQAVGLGIGVWCRDYKKIVMYSFVYRLGVKKLQIRYNNTHIMSCDLKQKQNIF